MQVSEYFYASFRCSIASTIEFSINLLVHIFNPNVTVKRFCNPYDWNTIIWTMTGL